MRNLFKVLAIAAVMVFGIQETTAQSLATDQSRPEEIAKVKATEISETLNLTEEQQRTIFRAYTANEVNYRRHIQGKDVSNPEVAANKQKFDTSLDKIMKDTLTPEQYAQWKKMK